MPLPLSCTTLFLLSVLRDSLISLSRDPFLPLLPTPSADGSSALSLTSGGCQMQLPKLGCGQICPPWPPTADGAGNSEVPSLR